VIVVSDERFFSPSARFPSILPANLHFGPAKSFLHDKKTYVSTIKTSGARSGAETRALNDYKDLGYRLHYWRTASGDEVDFVLYGERGLRVFDVKMAHNVRPDDLRALLRFREDFPEAKTHFLYLGKRRWHDRGIEVLPFLDCVSKLDQWL
jgi:hypothetical protein